MENHRRYRTGVFRRFQAHGAEVSSAPCPSGPRVKFPRFEHLPFYDGLHDRNYLNISFSDMTPFTIKEFRGFAPSDSDLAWGDVAGMPAVRSAIARLHRVARENVLITTGATE